MEPDQEIPFPRPLSGAAVKNTPSGLIPARAPLDGRDVRLEPLNPSEQAAELFEASHNSEEAQRIWDYLPDGPWPNLDSFEAWLRNKAALFERVTYAIRSTITGRACGMASYLDIHPQAGIIEIGYILVRSGATTDARGHGGLLSAARLRPRRTRLSTHAVALQCPECQIPSRRAAAWVPLRGYLLQSYDRQREQPRYGVVFDPRR